MPRRDRSKEDIIAAMLQLLSQSPVESTYYIMYRAILGYIQFKQYFELLRSKDLITRTANGAWFVTDKGREYIHTYRELMRIIEGGYGKE